jgi:pimeloyl-ACP methyl ester carboxylesterase
MKTKRVSSYKTGADREFVEHWIASVQTLNDSFYQKLTVQSSFGEVVVLALNHDRPELEPLVILPGARTFGMYWDLNNNLGPLKENFRIYLVDVIGQPGLSAGNSPDVRSDELGLWVVEVLDALGLDAVNIAGASFGGLLAMKLANAAAWRIKKMVLLNPIGFSYISLAPVSLFWNLLPIALPNHRNVSRFVDHIVLAGGEEVPPDRRVILIEIILQTLRRFNFKADLPYKMPDCELTGWSVPTWLIVGDKDALIPHQNTIKRARATANDLREVHILKETGHGIELSKSAMILMTEILDK